jgi:arginyl-tRNA--protein-N-Asp/Glu arginylyltransferase
MFYRYFLITPKLLSELMYHPRMKVHCIYSGDWIEPDNVMDYQRYFEAGRRLKAQGMM